MGLLIRRAEPADHRGFTSLVSRAGGPGHFRKIFGSYNFGQMIETSYLSVSALAPVSSSNDVGALLGFAVFSDAPKKGEGEDVLQWISEKYAPADAELKITNTLWVEFAVAHGDRTGSDAPGIIQNIVRTVFNSLPEMDYLVMRLPGANEGKAPETPAFLATTFELMVQHSDVPSSKFDDLYGDPSLFLCDRMAFLPTLAVRTACIEDHDDLLPIFEAQRDLLRATYGEFFLADMIQMQDEENKALVALVQQRACGLIATSSDLELGLLKDCFHLEAYDHLVKARALKVLLLGPPGAGKTRLAMALADRYGVVLVSVEAEAKLAMEKGDETGKPEGKGKEL
ncbi:unnamed protein product [Choristocarpus tenellus]